MEKLGSQTLWDGGTLDRGWGARGAAGRGGGSSVVGVEKTTSSNLISQVLEFASFSLSRHTLTSSWAPFEKRLNLIVLWGPHCCPLCPYWRPGHTLLPGDRMERPSVTPNAFFKGPDPPLFKDFILFI